MSAPEPTDTDRVTDVPARQTGQDPFAAPRSDITLGPAVKSDELPSDRAKSMMSIGVVLSVGWPLVFGTMASSQEGRWGMMLAFIVVTTITLRLVWTKATPYQALATGLLILGILSVLLI